jgi:hypothetical protein
MYLKAHKKKRCYLGIMLHLKVWYDLLYDKLSHQYYFYNIY